MTGEDLLDRAHQLRLLALRGHLDARGPRARTRTGNAAQIRQRLNDLERASRAGAGEEARVLAPLEQAWSGVNGTQIEQSAASSAIRPLMSASISGNYADNDVQIASRSFVGLFSKRASSFSSLATSSARSMESTGVHARSRSSSSGSVLACSTHA